MESDDESIAAKKAALKKEEEELAALNKAFEGFKAKVMGQDLLDLAEAVCELSSEVNVKIYSPNSQVHGLEVIGMDPANISLFYRICAARDVSSECMFGVNIRKLKDVLKIFFCPCFDCFRNCSGCWSC